MATSLDDFFSPQVFLIVLRETLELAIIISVLLAFIHQSFVTNKKSSADTYASTDEDADSGEALLPHNPDPTPEISKEESNSIYRYLRLQIWVGGLLGLVCCLICGTVILAIFYLVGSDLWSVTEHYWEGTFSIVASIIISVMGIKILRVNKMQEKWKKKMSVVLFNTGYLEGAIQRRESTVAGTWREKLSLKSEKYSMLILPFVTTLREGMEAIVFIGGIGINEDTSFWAIINSVVVAICIGSVIGMIMYRSGNNLSLQWFLIISTGFLYLVAAGLFSKGVWNFELQRFIDLCNGFDVSETGHGPGSYDITKSVWHVNCCNGELQDDGPFWMIVTAVFGWTNSATYGSVISYIGYWVVMITAFNSLIYEEKQGKLPVIPIKWQEKRIKKKLESLTNHPQPDIIEEVRASVDTMDSETPLNA